MGDKEIREERFGDFIKRKRLEQELTMRQMAERLGCSAPFLSDVEKGRRNPFDKEKMDIFAGAVGLSEAERYHLYDLAETERNEVAADLPEIIIGNDYVKAALRTAHALGAEEEEWQRFIDDLKRRKG